ncbi:MAG: translation initiation factor IF-3 [Deltaproteobacteria bacterium]|nr:translation initiation factor IF-3 [Deltaproteobacteria bacterium]
MAKDTVRINRMIRASEIRVLGSDGGQLGIMSVRDALTAAEAEGLDLVEISPGAAPPVCRIMDYGKFKYQQSKKSHEAKKKQSVVLVKEVKLGPKTEEHDFQFKFKHVLRFLEDGNKAKVTVLFRGREMAHTEFGRALLDRMAEMVKDHGVIEQSPRQEGRNMTMIIAPKK